MNKTKYLLIAAVAVLSLTLWGSSRSFVQADEFGERTMRGSDTFDANWLIGYRVYSPNYTLGGLGQIDDLLIDRCDGRVAFVVVSNTPGFFSEYLVVPFGAIDRVGEHLFRVALRDRDAALGIRGQWDAQLADPFAEYLAQNKSIVGLKSIPATVDSAWAESVYRFYGVTPFWTEGKNSHPEIVSYTMSGRTDEFAIHYPDGGVIASYGAAPYWTSCGSCGAEAMNFQGVAEPQLPSDAKPGECYARFFVAPRCETVSEQVMTRAASERVEEIPAKYETFDERVMVKPASKRIEEIPAEYKTVDEQVMVEPARTEWRPGRGAVEKRDPGTGKIMCLVEIPAQYKTVQKQVLVKPATTREVEIPAQYEMRKATKMVEPAQERHIQIPAEYKTVTRTDKVADGFFEWKKVEGCHAE